MCLSNSPISQYVLSANTESRTQCDLQRPACGQCQRLNLQCDGYSRDLVWVNVAPKSSLVHRQSVLGPTDITLTETLTRSAYHEKYLGMFWDKYLPNGRAFPPEAIHYTSGIWMNELQRLFRTEKNQFALKKILLALALANASQQSHDQWMTEEALGLYGTSLATLAKQLDKENGMISENSFAASKLLSLYEVSKPHGQTPS